MISRLHPFLNLKEYIAVLKPAKVTAIKEFENAFARLMLQKHAVVFPYGRSGLLCLLKALDISGKEIITPAWTCVVVSHAIVLSGNEPVFVDCASRGFNMDLDVAEKMVSENTGAIIATSIFGEPIDLDKLEIFRKKYPHVKIIQDCAHSFGCTWNNNPVVSYGDAAIFGLNISKVMNSIFGGMVTTNDDDLAAKLHAVRSKLIKPASWYKSLQRRLYFIAATISLHPWFYTITNWIENNGFLNRFVKYYDDAVIDFPSDWNISFTNVEASVGIEQCKKYTKIIECRRKNAEIYLSFLKDVPDLVLPENVSGSTWSHFTLLVPDGMRERIVKEMHKKGIQIGILIEYCIPEMKAYVNRRQQEKCPLASNYARRSINLPVWVDCSTAELIIKTFIRVFYDIKKGDNDARTVV